MTFIAEFKESTAEIRALETASGARHKVRVAHCLRGRVCGVAVLWRFRHWYDVL